MRSDVSPQPSHTPLPGFGLGRVWSFSRRHRRAVIALSVLLLAVSLAASFFLTFEGELKNLQPRSSEAFLTQEKLEKHLSLSPKQLLVTVEGKNLEELMGRGSRIASLAERYQRKGQIVAWSSLDRVVNSPETQREILADLAKSAGSERWEQRVAGALERNDFDLEPFQPFLTGLARLKDARATPLAEGMEYLAASPLRGVVDRHLVQDGNGWHLLVYLYYSGKEFSQKDFLRDLAVQVPSARATSIDMVSSQLAESVQQSFLWGFLLGGTLVLCLLLAHFESLSGIFASLFPVLSGVLVMTGMMAITGMGLNFMNAMVLVTILGMGSDYGLHIAHRVGGARRDGEKTEYVQAGRAVLLSALTTIAGFGSLAFTDYGAMSSIGWATNYGIAATALFALVFLPAFLPGKTA
ncbi:MAG: MMPL family transporter [Chromatiales bacterium]|nr:MMPL family transporter [Chromatiales bacterium]